MPKFLYWRKDSLWCAYPLPGYPDKFPLGIYTTGTPTDRRRCERVGESKLAALRTKAMQGTLFDRRDEEAHRYNPKFWRLVGRYWHNHLRFKRSAKESDRYHLAHCLKKFGSRYAKEIYRSDIEAWMHEMSKTASVNAVNNRYSYLKATYRHANSEDNPRRKLDHDPTTGLKKLPGAKVRQFVLTEELFERNYAYLQETSPRFALFYLGMWETGRRPWEVKRYAWEMVQEVVIDGARVRVLCVPNEICKTDAGAVLPISDRLWEEIRQTIPHEGPIFRNTKGEPWGDYRFHIAKLKAKFPKDCGWLRDTRRGFVTHKTEVLKMDPAHVQAFSGHATDAIFRRYRIGRLSNLVSVANAGKGTFQVHFEQPSRKTGENG